MKPPVRQRLPRGAALPRHRHAEPYFAVVLAGGYEEAGDGGRRHVSAGDVVIHSAFEAHLDRLSARGAEILNLPFDGAPRLPAFAALNDVDQVARLAEDDPRAAAQLVLAELRAVSLSPADWPERLAADINADPSLEIAAWARAHNLTPEAVSRGFGKVFGVSPKRFRLEARARDAWRELAAAPSLADLAADKGFCDQAHMTRAVTALTGRSPGSWIKSLQDA